MRPEQDNPTGDNARLKGRRQLMFLTAIFFAPLVFAGLMFYGVIDWRPRDSSANGELYTPAVPLPAAVPVYGHRSYDGDFLRQRWSLVYIAKGACDNVCEATLLQMSQVHASLGKYADRIGRAMLAATLPEPLIIDKLQRSFPGLEIVQAKRLAEVILSQRPATGDEWIYLVDPLGNLVLRFAKEQGPRPMYNDLKRLLKLSRIG